MVSSACSRTRYYGSGAVPAAEGETQECRWGRAVHKTRWRLIEQYAGTHVLDAGCGAGAYVRRLTENGYHPVGLDIELPPDTPRGVTCAGRAEQLPFADESFDTVLLINVLEHLDDDVLALHEAHRVCRHNLILSVPRVEDPVLGKYGLTCSPYTDFGHRRHYSEETLRSALCASGFRPEWIRPVMPVNPLGLVLRMFHLPGKDLGKLIHACPGVRKIYTTLHAVGRKA